MPYADPKVRNEHRRQNYIAFREREEANGRIFRKKRPKAISEEERKDRKQEYFRQYSKDHKHSRKSGSQRKYDLKWLAKNPNYKMDWQREKQATDIAFKIKRRLQGRVSSALKKAVAVKSDQTSKLLGCSIGRFMEYLKAHFKPGMTFNNHGQWHIDHKRPCASFNLQDFEQQKQCFNWLNLQPLWAADNLRKHAKYESPMQTQLA